jgi:hypothetical protein
VFLIAQAEMRIKDLAPWLILLAIAVLATLAVMLIVDDGQEKMIWRTMEADVTPVSNDW